MSKLTGISGKRIVKDLSIGTTIAFVSVPLAMGYAQIAGLPPQYGLYGSMLAPLVFGLISSSPRFFFSVDAAPAALTGALLAELGVAFGSDEAVSVMPLITMLTAAWIFLFWLLGVGRFAKYISEPVLGGCVSGIASVLIFGQLPALFGGTTGHGRALTLLSHFATQINRFHTLSFVIGCTTVAVILLSRRIWPQRSMSVGMLAIGLILGLVLRVDRYGVALMGQVPRGIYIVGESNTALVLKHLSSALIDTLLTAIVIVSETLVSTREVAREHGEHVSNQRELLAYAAGNLAASLFGSSPVSGSISRTRRANNFHVSSQWMSVSASASMVPVLLFGTRLIPYLPVPVLTGIVVASLVSMVEIPLARELLKLDRRDFYIFCCAFLAEFFGLSEGVVLGVILSFASFTLRASSEPSHFLGRIKGEEGFFALGQSSHARPINGTILYQFTGPLFFANIDQLEDDISGMLRPDSTLVIITGVASIDLVAAKRLLAFYRSLKQRGIRLFLAGHASSVNEQLIQFGASEMVQDGAVHQRLTHALHAGGLTPPYPIEGGGQSRTFPADSAVLENYTWTYGKYAGPQLDTLATQLAGEVTARGLTPPAEEAQTHDAPETPEKETAAAPEKSTAGRKKRKGRR